MRALYTLCYPELLSTDRVFIEEVRQEHDLANRGIVAAHFTMVFGIQEIEDSVYVEHVRAVAASACEVQFVCRYAMLGADSASDTAYIFLVPDEGYSGISRLHDRLYAGPLEGFHRLDIPYVPHITLASKSDRKQAKALCDQLNQKGIMIAGAIKAFTVGSLEDGKFVSQCEVQLGRIGE